LTFWYFTLPSGRKPGILVLVLPAYRHLSIDIRDLEAPDPVFSEYGADIGVVIHAVAQPLRDWTGHDSLTYFGLNAVGTLTCLPAPGGSSRKRPSSSPSPTRCGDPPNSHRRGIDTGSFASAGGNERPVRPNFVSARWIRDTASSSSTAFSGVSEAARITLALRRAPHAKTADHVRRQHELAPVRKPIFTGTSGKNRNFPVD
jgi:hypothetical protein